MSEAEVLGELTRPAGGTKIGAKHRSSGLQRTPITPPVCGVHPGHTLALRTTIGLNAALDEINLKATQEAFEPATTASSRGTLKTARLQPLRPITTSPQTMNQCLGIVPVALPPSTSTRPYSCTVPSNFEIGPLNAHFINRKWALQAKRSQSAVSAPLVRPERLGTPRHFALVPQTQYLTAPPEERHGWHSTTELKDNLVRFEDRQTRPQSKPGTSQELTNQTAELASDQEAETRSRVCIISLGEEDQSKPRRQSGHQHKQSSGGKLSQGWSPPKPLGAVSGTSVHIITNRRGPQAHVEDPGQVMEPAFSEQLHIGAQEPNNEQPLHQDNAQLNA